MSFLRLSLPATLVFLRAKPVIVALLLCLCPHLFHADENLARDLANPFSSLWNVVNQINFNQLKGGPFKDSHTQFNWNLQPVMPVPHIT